MNLCHDRQVKFFYLFISFFVLILFVCYLGLYRIQLNAVQNLFLIHDSAVVSSLLEQGVSKEIIGKAITNDTSYKNGIDFLIQIGVTKKTAIRFFPFISEFQHTIMYYMLFSGIFLSVLLFIGVFVFLLKREKLYQQALQMISHFIDGDFTYHINQKCEGTIYQLFSSIEQLATMLKSKNENDSKVKEFLKSTISDISHQLKTPLAALTLYQEIISEESDNIDIVKEFSAKAELALKRIEQLIHSMLKITRLDAGNIIFKKDCYSILELIKKSISELTARAINENKEIQLNGSPDEKIICDIHWTSEAIGNIVKNALDHIKSGEAIQILWEHSPAMIRISICDNGVGIAPEDIHHIFKRFYRSKNSLDIQGIGLGLPLAKSIIEGQGGIISVQSSLNEGTTFTLSFLTEM